MTNHVILSKISNNSFQQASNMTKKTHKLPKQAGNIKCKVQKTHKNKTLSSVWELDYEMVYEMGSKRSIGPLWWCYEVCDHWGYIVQALRIKWEDTIMSKLEYYIENIKPWLWPQYKVKMPERIQSHLTTPKSLGSKLAFTDLLTPLHKLSVEVTSGQRNQKYEDTHSMEWKPIGGWIPLTACIHNNNGSGAWYF